MSFRIACELLPMLKLMSLPAKTSTSENDPLVIENGPEARRMPSVPPFPCLPETSPESANTKAVATVSVVFSAMVSALSTCSVPDPTNELPAFAVKAPGLKTEP